MAELLARCSADCWRAQTPRLAVERNVHRKGVARRLIAEIESRLYACGAHRIYALVDRRTAAAGPFWESEGYVANDEIVQYSRNL